MSYSKGSLNRKQKKLSSLDEGLLLFARYAFMPNKLGFCGPNENQLIFESVVKNKVRKNLEKALYQFPGALLYLNKIAESSKINELFNKKIVEAYFLGNSNLEKVPIRVNHQFHVFNLFPFTSKLKRTLNNMDLCRISWGKVRRIFEDKLEVEYSPLIDKNGRLMLGKLRWGFVYYRLKNKSFVRNVKVGDIVSFHWQWACQILNPTQTKNLKKYTQYQLNLINAQNT